MKRLCLIWLSFAAILVLCALMMSRQTSDPLRREYLVALNEIEQLSYSGQQEQAAIRAAELRKEISAQDTQKNPDLRIWVTCGICLLFSAALTGYYAREVVRPFEKLSSFADKIASGNFDLPLDYDRSNYFGRFTWGFDRMRREISNARACEQAAIENNKIVIASLSHDIKTPVASVRAYAEALEMGMDTTPEQRAEFLATMMRKCDEITKLTDDMLLHALSDLGKLQMKPAAFELAALTASTVTELSAGMRDVRFTKPLFAAPVYADAGRIAQIIENLITNARKYAGTEIEIMITRSGDYFELHISDQGGGIPDEDMPFVFNRFYRGSNSGSVNGSGLGLYIVKYIAEQSGGSVRLENLNGGLHVTVSIPAAKDEDCS